MIGIPEGELKAQARGLFSAPPPSNPDALWPDGERVDFDAKPEGVDAANLEAAVKAVFADQILLIHAGRAHLSSFMTAASLLSATPQGSTPLCRC